MAASPTEGDKCSRNGRALERGYRDGTLLLSDVVGQIAARSRASAAQGTWIHRAPKEELEARIEALEARRAAGAPLPLFGWPFAVKDNIDVAGMPTSAGCPAYTYAPSRSATAVERLTAAGAIVIGKSNLDQFATGLVGTRSPYGIPINPFDASRIPGGSSSGSAVAVATGLAAFALGTDTAGSGRVPAALNNIVGFKPSRGLISATGVVPACRTLDCVSVFALTCQDAWRVFQIVRGFDPEDPFSRDEATASRPAFAPEVTRFRFGVPEPLEFFGDAVSEASFADAIALLRELGGRAVPIDYRPFLEVAGLLYGGPWVAERLVAAGALLRERPEALEPTVRAILSDAQRFDAKSVFEAQSRLALLRRQIAPTWRDLDALVVPTVPRSYTIAEVQADPLRSNTRLGHYTNFVNLLDLCALAVPAGMRPDGLPFGISFIAPHGHDEYLLRLGALFHARANRRVGAFAERWTGDPELGPHADLGHGDEVCVAVVGAHLSGEPLNHQLTALGASLVRTARTAPRYRLFALPDTAPAKPGMIRVEGEAGVAVEVEVWRLSTAGFGAFVAAVGAPLCIGSLELEDGSAVHGFLCEGTAVRGALDISSFGGWRGYRRVLALKEEQGGRQ